MEIDPLKLLYYLPVLTIAIVTSFCIHRLYFHPYAKYPGPLLGRLTNLYAIYHVYKGDLHKDLWRCHEQYGEVVRYAPHRISINSEAVVKDDLVFCGSGVYGPRKNVTKSVAYCRFSLIKGLNNLLATLDNKEHAKRRRIVNQGLADAQVHLMESTVRPLALTLAKGLGEANDRFDAGLVASGDGWSAPKNMAKWCGFYTFDVISKLVIDISYNLLGNAANHWVLEATAGVVTRLGYLLMLPEIEDTHLHRLLFPNVRPKAAKFIGKVKEMFKQREAREMEKNGKDVQADVFSKLLHAVDPETGEGLSDQQLVLELFLLMTAGSDTTATSIAALFFYLCRHPAAYARIVDEVRTNLSSLEDVRQGPKLSSCTYLHACIYEVLRLVPPASGPLWRQAMEGGLHIPAHDIFVPPGYEVGTCVYALNHHKEIFPDPFSFRPERWISSESGAEAVAKAKAAFASFSFGSRNCPGKNLAMIESTLALAATILLYDFREADAPLRGVGEDKGQFRGQYDVFWAFSGVNNGPYIQFKPVQDS